MESTLILAFLFTAPGAFADSATPATATPQFALPSYPGKSIEVMVPATLDLAARAELALRVIGGLAAQWQRRSGLHGEWRSASAPLAGPLSRRRRSKSGRWRGGYFPHRGTSRKKRIGGLDCTLIIKGSAVVRMEPGGILNPLYQREHYRQNETLWLSKKVFIADSVLEW